MRNLTSVVLNATSNHSASVFILHGLGDSGAGWEPVAAQLSRKFPHVKWILPNAPLQPVSVNFGMKMPSWCDIKSLDSINGEEDEQGMLDSVRDVNALIRKEVDNGIPADRIVIAGFSQGGAISLLLGLTSEYKFAGIVALSTYLPVRNNIFKASRALMVADANRKTPILMCHGNMDPVVKYEYGLTSSELLKKEKYNVTFKTYNGLGHSSCMKELEDVIDFFKKVISPK